MSDIMESTINQRIEQLAKSSLLRSKRELAIKAGIAQSTLESIIKGAEPRFGAIHRILVSMPQVSADWLMLGEGPMLRIPSGSVTISKNDMHGNSGNIAMHGGTVIAENNSELDRLREENKTLRERCDKLTDKLLNTL